MKHHELESLAPLNLGRYPTPVRRLTLETGATELWIKDDGVSNPVYGGNKVRKLELVLADALRKNSRRIVTAGSAASHHVLATAIFAKQAGLPVAAVVCPQPRTDHAEATLAATFASGIDLIPVGSMAAIPFKLARVWRRGDYFIPPGGSSVLGSVAYLHATLELLEQIREGALPEPEVIVAALGSGGTVAGLLAGVVREGLRCRILGIDIATATPIARTLALGLAERALKLDAGDADLLRLARRLEVDGSARGRGYGYPTPAGERALEEAKTVGLELNPTYTAKTFDRALALCRSANAPRTVLYWHTLSSAPLEAGLGRASERLLFTG